MNFKQKKKKKKKKTQHFQAKWACYLDKSDGIRRIKK